MRRNLDMVLSCEHGGNSVPAMFADLFTGHEDILIGHRGWDPGTVELSRLMASKFNVPLISTLVTRLLVDCNRSIGNPTLFSEVTDSLSESVKSSLIASYHTPHWMRVIREAGYRIETGESVLHLSVHSFTPVLNGEVRQVDIGLLYDPDRALEQEFADLFEVELRATVGNDLCICHNEPYRGTADGICQSLRGRWDEDKYLGFELEVNQRFPLGGGEEWQMLKKQITLASGRARVQFNTING